MKPIDDGFPYAHAVMDKQPKVNVKIKMPISETLFKIKDFSYKDILFIDGVVNNQILKL